MTRSGRGRGRVVTALLLVASLAACKSPPKVDLPSFDLRNGTCLGDADCDSGAHCSPAHLCVECLTDDDCALGDRCDPALLRCTSGCTASHGCPAPLHCEDDAGVCAECVIDDDCPAPQVCHGYRCLSGCDATHPCPSGRKCQIDAATCVACLGADCQGDPLRPYCNPSIGCVACLPDAAGRPDTCPAHQVCGAAGQCITGCRSDADCNATDGGFADAPRCNTILHQCQQCLGDADCNGRTGSCIEGGCLGSCAFTNLCSSGQLCCAKTCTDVLFDSKNCGACGVPCNPSTQVCATGACRAF